MALPTTCGSSTTALPPTAFSTARWSGSSMATISSARSRLRAARSRCPTCGCWRPSTRRRSRRCWASPSTRAGPAAWIRCRILGISPRCPRACAGRKTPSSCRRRRAISTTRANWCSSSASAGGTSRKRRRSITSLASPWATTSAKTPGTASARASMSRRGCSRRAPTRGRPSARPSSPASITPIWPSKCVLTARWSSKGGRATWSTA